MNQKKIRRFIADRRMAMNLTQTQLADKLNITNRVVSKWETGLAVPDVYIIPDLCCILKITSDDLLNGEIISSDQKNANTSSVKERSKIKAIPPFLGIISVICSMFLYGATGYCHEAYNKFGFEMSRKLIHFIFGGGPLYKVDDRISDYVGRGRGISLFGVISFLCLIVSFVLFIHYAIRKKRSIYMTASFLQILSGILILFILEHGTTVGGNGFGGFKLYEFFGDSRLGAGTILWSVFCISGGLLGSFLYYIESIRYK